MDKSISYLANKTAETADMLKYPAIRLFHVGYPRTATREILQGIFLPTIAGCFSGRTGGRPVLVAP